MLCIQSDPKSSKFCCFAYNWHPWLPNENSMRPCYWTPLRGNGSHVTGGAVSDARLTKPSINGLPNLHCKNKNWTRHGTIWPSCHSLFVISSEIQIHLDLIKKFQIHVSKYLICSLERTLKIVNLELWLFFSGDELYHGNEKGKLTFWKI